MVSGKTNLVHRQISKKKYENAPTYDDNHILFIFRNLLSSSRLACAWDRVNLKPYTILRCGGKGKKGATAGKMYQQRFFIISVHKFGGIFASDGKGKKGATGSERPADAMGCELFSKERYGCQSTNR